MHRDTTLRPRGRGGSRRELLRQIFWSAGTLGAGGGLLSACGGGSGADGQSPPMGKGRFADIGALGEPDDLGLSLPEGFSARSPTVRSSRCCS